MKTFTKVAIALCMVCALAVPAMAVDADFSGQYRVRGFFNDNVYSTDLDASSAWMDMRLRMQTVFTVSDNLKLTTRFDALDNKNWGDGDLNTGRDADNIDFDRAYMTIKTGYGQFDVGRMAKAAFGTVFFDSGTEADRIKYTLPIDNFTLLAIYQKNTENDKNDGVTGAGLTAADEDSDSYLLAGTYKAENYTTGLLYVFNPNKTVPTQDTTLHTLNPYFIGTFGALGIEAELKYIFGTTDYDAAGVQDLDKDAMAFQIEGTYDLGVAKIEAGYGFFSGDNDATDNDDEAFTDGFGDDWEKVWILTNSTDEFSNINLSKTGMGTTGSTAGANLFYVGASYAPIENLTLGVLIAYAEADAAPAGWDDEYGMEYDFKLNWKIYDNLSYSFIAAFLDAGDFFKQGVANPANYDDSSYALYNALVLNF